jgi:hypothetical protein
MPANDYIPTKDGDLVPWTENFIAVANANLATLGLVATDITALTTKKSDYSTKLNTAIAKQAESKAATDAKNTSKDTLVSNIRLLARQIQVKPGVPDNLRQQLGLNIPDPSPSPSQVYPPVDLSGNIGVAGLASLKWSRNNNTQGTTFLVEYSNNYETGWHIIGTTSKVSYETPLSEMPGRNFFRIKAQRSDAISEPSNIIIL